EGTPMLATTGGTRMRRLAVLMLCCAATTLVAAPAPLPKREREKGPWFTGWSRPVDPVGGCEFVRLHDALAIRVPGAGHRLTGGDTPPTDPHLMRHVEGDFVLTVRARCEELIPPTNGQRGGGLLLLSESGRASLQFRGTREATRTYSDFRATAESRNGDGYVWKGGAPRDG